MSDIRKFRVELPERKSDEPDMTDAQRQYIRHLFDKLEVENFTLNLEQLGKWQACSLIEELIETKDIINSNRFSLNTATVKADFSNLKSSCVNDKKPSKPPKP